MLSGIKQLKGGIYMLYKNLVKMITRGTYDKEDLVSKMDIYLLNNRITESEYSELTTLMDK